MKPFLTSYPFWPKPHFRGHIPEGAWPTYICIPEISGIRTGKIGETPVYQDTPYRRFYHKGYGLYVEVTEIVDRYVI